MTTLTTSNRTFPALVDGTTKGWDNDERIEYAAAMGLRTFGIEIECGMPNGCKAIECRGGHYDPAAFHSYLTDWKSSSDGSLANFPVGYKGVEIVSPVLVFPIDLPLVRMMVEYLKDEEAFVNYSCGGHVHVGISYEEKQDENYLLSINNIMSKVQYAIYAYNGADNRRDGTYCKAVHEGSVDTSDRYHTVNFYNVRPAASSGKRTVEFRIFSGTVSYADWERNITLSVRIMEMAKDLNAQSSIKHTTMDNAGVRYLRELFSLPPVAKTNRYNLHEFAGVWREINRVYVSPEDMDDRRERIENNWEREYENSAKSPCFENLAALGYREAWRWWRTYKASGASFKEAKRVFRANVEYWRNEYEMHQSIVYAVYGEKPEYCRPIADQLQRLTHRARHFHAYALQDAEYGALKYQADNYRAKCGSYVELYCAQFILEYSKPGMRHQSVTMEGVATRYCYGDKGAALAVVETLLERRMITKTFSNAPASMARFFVNTPAHDGIHTYSDVEYTPQEVQQSPFGFRPFARSFTARAAVFGSPVQVQPVIEPEEPKEKPFDPNKFDY
jgi:hypothetical protein